MGELITIDDSREIIENKAVRGVITMDEYDRYLDKLFDWNSPRRLGGRKSGGDSE